MARFSGIVGFSRTVEEPPNSGIWVEVAYDHPVFGDFVREGRRWEKSEQANDNLVINNYVSVVLDKFMKEHCQYVKWVEIEGSKWKVSSVEIEYPRIKLTLGGRWNGE